MKNKPIQKEVESHKKMSKKWEQCTERCRVVCQCGPLEPVTDQAQSAAIEAVRGLVEEKKAQND